MAGEVSPVLVRSRGCSGTAPRPHGRIIANEKQDREKTTRLKPRARQRRNENQSDQRIRGRSGQGPALLYGGTWLCQEDRLQSGPISLADRGFARGARRHGTATGAEQQFRGQSVSAGDL